MEWNFNPQDIQTDVLAQLAKVKVPAIDTASLQKLYQSTPQTRLDNQSWFGSTTSLDTGEGTVPLGAFLGNTPQVEIPLKQAAWETSPSKIGAGRKVPANSSFVELIRFAENSKGNAQSPTGARGTMQVLRTTARKPGYGITGITDQQFDQDPAAIDALGENYANAMLEKYQDPILAALAYNQGTGTVDRIISRIQKGNKYDLSPEAVRYLQRVAPYTKPTNSLSRTLLGNALSKASRGT